MLGFQKDLAAIYDIRKENFKTSLNLTKKENSLFSGCENAMEKLVKWSEDVEYIGKPTFAKIPNIYRT